MSLLATAYKEKISQMNVNQGHTEQRMPQALPGYSGGRLPGRSKEGREEREEDEGREERRVRNEIIKEVIAGMQKKAIDEGVENQIKKNRRAGPHAKLGLLAD